MKKEQLIILKRELDLLKKHFKDCNLSDYNKKKLLSELESARVMKDDQLPEDAVCIDSEVEVREINSGQKFKFQIVLPSEANMKTNKVSVFAPISIALLGYRTGSQVQWEMPNGLKTFEILKVNHQRIKEEQVKISA